MFVMLGRSNCFFITRTHRPSRGIRPLSWKAPSPDSKILAFVVGPTVNLLAVLGNVGESFIFDATLPVYTLPEQRPEMGLLTLMDCTSCLLAMLPVLEHPGFPECRRIQGP